MKNLQLLLCLGLFLLFPHHAFSQQKTLLNPLDFGAKGDGKTDDTEAFNKLNEAIGRSEGPVNIHIPAGIFMVNPLKTPMRKLAPGILRRKCLIWLRRDHSKVTCAGQIKIIKGPDYKKGMKKGDEWYWSVVLIRANYCTVDGLNFSGNGTGTYRGWISKQANLRWEGVSALGTGDHKTVHTGNRVVNCNIVEGGGQAVGMQFQNQALIANNIFKDSSGAGFSASHDSIIMNNTATNSHDAPYLANGRCNNIIIANNISRGTTNGSGIDVVGCSNVLVQGNVIENSAAWGLLIGYSAQLKNGCDRILVKGNLFVNNCRSTDTPMNGEVCVGRPWKPTPNVGKNVTVMGNKFIINGTHGNYKGNFVSIAHGCDGVEIINNVVNGKTNKQNAIITIWAPARNLRFSGNMWMEKSNAQVAVKSPVEGYFELIRNRNIIMAKDAKSLPDKIQGK